MLHKINEKCRINNTYRTIFIKLSNLSSSTMVIFKLRIMLFNSIHKYNASSSHITSSNCNNLLIDTGNSCNPIQPFILSTFRPHSSPSSSGSTFILKQSDISMKLRLPSFQ
ncbi:hypothetical protein Hanom_Chr07g00631521 [Helianthus anomalus]